jgi:hypothetical protein
LGTEHSDSFLHQIFMIVMETVCFGIRSRVTYKTINIYLFISFFLSRFVCIVLKVTRKKNIWLLPATFLFFLLNIEAKSSLFFWPMCCVLNYIAGLFGSNYTNMSVYLCVVIPAALRTLHYQAIWHENFEIRRVSLLVLGLFLYFVIIYQNFLKRYSVSYGGLSIKKIIVTKGTKKKGLDFIMGQLK